MESLSLQDCKNCFFLPPLGQLTALKKLHIVGMDGITVIGEEFYGDSSTSKPFQALEELKFSNMAEWAIWNTPSYIDFSSLKDFSISNCPKLVKDFPFDVTSLENFEIRGLTSLQYNQAGSLKYNPSFQVSTSTEKMTPADESKMCGCPRLSLFLQSSVTKQLMIGQCIDLEFPTSDSCNSYLEILRVESCGDSVEPIPLFSFSKIREVYIDKWESMNLFKLPNGYHQTLTTSLQSLEISNCSNILSFPEVGLPAPNLNKLLVKNCKKLKSLPARMHTQLSLLHVFGISSCPEIECFNEGGLPPSLETLRIENCEKMMISQTNWGLHRLRSLRVLSIGGFDGTLFPEERVLSSGIRVLVINNIRNLESLSGKCLQHLCSLRAIFIENCPNLRYLPEEKLSSLSQMQISSCENLESFPEDGLTSSLSWLVIDECPKLEARMEREKGEDWHKISHIHFIMLDNVVIS